MMVRGTDCVSWSLTLEAKDVETGGIVSLAILETSQTHANTQEEKHTNTHMHRLLRPITLRPADCSSLGHL